MRTLRGELVGKGLTNTKRAPKKKREDATRKKKTEKLSHRDLLDLMGTNRQIYEKRGGAVRSRR